MSRAFDLKATVVLSRLLRDGEESALAWPVTMRRNEEAQASWADFIEARFGLWQRLSDSGVADHMSVGWWDAAVRLYGGEAREALWSFYPTEWPGRGNAEAQLIALNAGILRERKAWERK